MNRTVIYARYSCDRQNEASIEGQLRECYEYAKQHDLTVVDTYIDRAISGTSDAREQFQRMIADSDKHLYDVVLLYKLDRFSRNRYDSAIYKSKLKKNGVKILYAKESIPDGPEGIILESLLEGMAEYYSAELSQKIKRGMRENALKGMVTGGHRALGFHVTADKRLEINEETAPIVRTIFEMYDQGHTVTEICSILNAQGYKTVTGAKFNKNSLWFMLKNEKYIGVYQCLDIRIEDCFPAIISKDLFDRVQKRLATNAKTPARKKAKVDYLLSGKLYCGQCNDGMVGESGTGKSGGKHHYYICVNKKRKKTCDKKTVRKDWLEQTVVEETIHHILHPDKIDLISKRCAKIMENDTSQATVLAQLRKQLAETNRSLQNLTNALEQGVITKTTKNRLTELEQLQEHLEHEILLAELAQPKLAEKEIKYLLSQFVRETDEPLEEYSRSLIDTLVNTVHLYNDKLIITYNMHKKNSTELESSVLQFLSDGTDPDSTGSAKGSDFTLVGGDGGNRTPQKSPKYQQ